MPRAVLLLLAVLLCYAAATLDMEEKQKEERERVSARELVKEGAVPEMPQNFQVFPESSSAVMVAWSPHSSDDDVDHYLVYVEDEGMEDTTEVYYYVWNGLKACTNYTFGVKAVSSKGNTSDPALGDGQTMVGIPPEPQNLHVKDYTHTTVTLVWEKPDTQCDIDHYRVRYGHEGSLPQETQVFETTLAVSNLLPDTTYTFSVYATTSEGEGPAATVEQTTAPDPGGPPEDLVAEGISSSAINVSWSAPYTEPLYYLVTAPPCMWDEKIVYDLTYVIKDLDTCQTCFITVTSYYRGGSRFPANTEAASKGDAPPPPEKCSVEVDKIFISVKWEKPATPCILGPYNVTWKWKKLWGDGEEESNSINTTRLSHIVSHPPPYHEYTFEISASIDGVFGSPTSCSNTSLESPPGPPVLQSVESEEEGVARVTWDSPDEENGEILQYGIFVNDAVNSSKEVSGDVHSTSISLEKCVSFGISVEARNHAGWGERSEVKDVMVVGDVLPNELRCREPDPEVQVCWKPYSKSCPVSQYNLKWEGDVLWSDNTDSNSTTLEWSEKEICYNITSTPYTNYTVELSVGTKLNETIQCSSTTPMAAPGPPTLEELQAEDLAINVTWKEPGEKNGVISAYQVKWTDWNGIENVKSTDGNTFSLQIVEPSCGGKVDVTVRARTTDVVEFGEESPPGSVFLVNSVSNLMCDPTVPGVIALSWEVVDSQCPIQEYNVTWTFVSLWSEDKGSNWESVDGNDDSAFVPSLPPYSNVSVEVHVDNSPEDTSCTATTLEQASSPPTEVHQITNGTNSVTVEWSRPESVRGKLVGWHLNWTTLSDEYLGEHDISDPENMTFQIRELSPSQTYVVYVMAVNGAGAGEAEVKNVTTAIAIEPPPDLGLILGVSIGGGVLLILLIVGGVILYKRKNKTKPPRSAPFMPDVIHNDNEKLSKKQHLSAANQRFQGKFGTIDFGTNSELYPDNDKTRDPSEEIGVDDGHDDGVNDGVDDGVDDGMIDGHNTAPGGEGNLFGVPGARRLSQQVSSSLPRQAAYNRRPSQQVNIRMKNFEEYNRRSSQQDFVGAYDIGVHSKQFSVNEDVGEPNLREFGRRSSQYIDLGRPYLKEFGRRPSQQIDLGRPYLKEFGRRPSQDIDLGRPNLKEFGRRPSQQIDVRRPNSMEYRRRPSQQIDQDRPRGEYSRRPSQQIDLGRPNLREYGRRPSQQIDIGRPRLGEYARRPSQQADMGGRFLPNRSPQQPSYARPAYDHYMRRPSQQANIGMPSDRAFMKRPSQQFTMSFEGIQEQ